MSRDRFRAGKRLWSQGDDAALRRIYPDTPVATIATRLRRSVKAVYQRAKELRLHKSAASLARHRRAGGDRLRRWGVASRFTPGHVPANKGLRRPGWAPGRMAATQFKKGALNGVALQRFKPIGSTRLVDGYRYRKISAVPGPWARNWKLEHVLVWERTHGPMPAGHALVFRDGDRTHVQLENLELITRRELMARNSVHNLPQPLAQAVQLLGALNRQVRRRTRDAEHDRRSA